MILKPLEGFFLMVQLVGIGCRRCSLVVPLNPFSQVLNIEWILVTSRLSYLCNLMIYLREHEKRMLVNLPEMANMMIKKMQIPAHAMYDGSDDMLFKHFTAVAQQIGVYSAWDYCDIINFLVDKWKVVNMKGLSDEGRKA